MSEKIKTKIIHVYGVVQGVGFRPFVSRLAKQFKINGEVSNVGSFVKIYAQGSQDNLKYFIESLKDSAPPRADITKLNVSECVWEEFEGFSITRSESADGKYYISPDIAICPVCQKELYDAENRRYMHPFINCTDCGPRFTILKEMPYDRERTSMSDFPMCKACGDEYIMPETRRYDTQPVCCNDCGPEVYLADAGVCGKKAITTARRMIKEGKLIAVKGIGGFHLCCDARNDEAVRYLRTIKHRPEKPLAVMMRNMEAVEQECVITDVQRTVLDGPEKPILLLRKRKDNSLAPSVVKGNPCIGVMLPYTPLHMLLFDYDDGVDIGTDCLVMTSGNISGAPICRTDDEAKKELSYCETILSHNREILIQADDSVIDICGERPYMVRRSRGYVPLPVTVSRFKKEADGIQILAAGSDLKNTFCLAKGSLFYLSAHIGDMASKRSTEVWNSNVEHMERLLRIRPEYVACDLHPQYHTTVSAHEMGIPVIPIQHHFAHIVSCMAENNFSDDVIGVALDGTGYGSDGTIWGAEFLEVSQGRFRRAGTMTPFWQIGGDSASREGWRIAVSMINSLYGEDAENVVKELGLCKEGTRRILM